MSIHVVSVNRQFNQRFWRLQAARQKPGGYGAHFYQAMAVTLITGKRYLLIHDAGV
jgi:hypothetical protein